MLPILLFEASSSTLFTCETTNMARLLTAAFKRPTEIRHQHEVIHTTPCRWGARFEQIRFGSRSASRTPSAMQITSSIWSVRSESTQRNARSEFALCSFSKCKQWLRLSTNVQDSHAPRGCATRWVHFADGSVTSEWVAHLRSTLSAESLCTGAPYTCMPVLVITLPQKVCLTRRHWIRCSCVSATRLRASLKPMRRALFRLSSSGCSPRN